MYELEAILAREETLRDAIAGFAAARLVRLPQGIGMIPMVGTLLQELEIRYQGGTEVTNPNISRFSKSLFPRQFERLIVGVDQFARLLSQHGLVAYVEASFTGGYGGHATMAWEHGKRLGRPGDSIDAMLHRLGVIRSPELDEFDTVGLGRHRITKQWLEQGAA